jgi:branched-subunit amino acid aminotransferase/4-amino-4-deoxychorismate lyase
MSDATKVYLDGRIIAARKALVSHSDRGFLYGDGFFETTRVVGGVPLLLDQHLLRLAGSCREAGFGDCVDADAIADGTRRLIEANGVREGRLRITLSRGSGMEGLAAEPAARPTVLIQAQAMDLPSLDVRYAVTLVVSHYRINERSPIVRHKSLSYQANLLALAEARRDGADEVILFNSRGEVAEGAVSNLFFVRDGTVCTPEVTCGILPGITRQVVLDLSRRAGIPCEEGAYGREALLSADEVFCTNSLRGLMVAERILNLPDLDLSGCAVTGRLRREYAGFVAGLCGAGA